MKGIPMKNNQVSAMKQISNNMGTLTAFGVIGIIGMIILPMPPILLDILLTFNITLAMIILLITMFTTDTLQFSSFPTLLLITTLFRLGLNVSSTRLILSQGAAGEVIGAFGGFVTGDNYVVGAIIFIIIVVIQFIVITNGAGRVAEVGARFTLDAMPGKQMSIDADLNAGVITDQDAKSRRQNLQREADFYGSMDGASKFVKGDAIAGIVIVIINFLGGITIFVGQKGLPFGEAIQKFGILTIGDGLVSQVPALLISVASGILVTRSATGTDFGSELSKQLMSEPKAIGIVSVVLLGLGLIPALPNFLFLSIGTLNGILAYFLNEEAKQKKRAESVKRAKPAVAIEREPEDVVKYIQVEALEIEIGYGLIALTDASSGGDLLDRIAAVRRQCATEMGIIVQPIRIRDNLQLPSDAYVIKIRGNEIVSGEVLHNHYLVMDPGNDKMEVVGKETVEPAFGLPAVWVDESQKDKAEMLGYTIVDPATVMVTHLNEVIRKYSHELLGRQEVKSLLDMLKEKYGAVVEELIPDLLSVGDLQKVLQNLLRERVPIKDLVTILETLADYAVNTKDTEILTEYVRHRIGRTIVKPYLNEKGSLDVITIHPDVEQKIYENIQKSFQGSFPAINPELNSEILEKLSQLRQESVVKNKKPVVLASPRIRGPFKRLVEITFSDLAVISLNEIPNSIEIEGVGMVKKS
ncbi:MAG: flagellar biosynthesis protein FlhA [Peptostreptococcaceae bacterium]|nr:flagellar biosynthesis protein FlhA [Peptostreptococcaceae bacterium]